MSFPRLVRAALERVAPLGLPGRTTFEVACEGSKHHSPTPLIVKEVALSPSGGGSTAWLCGTCSANLAVLQHLLVEHGGELPWPVRREFGNLIRALAERGWAEEADPATRTSPQASLEAKFDRRDSDQTDQEGAFS